jgi:hypothetical protein
LWFYPHSLSYFNELIGGPAHGPEHLLGSNVDWGQDLRYLKWWADAHPEARPLHLAYDVMFDPGNVGFDFALPIRRTLDPGWYAIGVNLLWSEQGTGRDGPSTQSVVDREMLIRLGNSVNVKLNMHGIRLYRKTST